VATLRYPLAVCDPSVLGGTNGLRCFQSYEADDTEGCEQE